MARVGVRRSSRVAVIAGIIFLGITSVPDAQMYSAGLICPTSTFAVQGLPIGRAAASPCPGLEWATSHGGVGFLGAVEQTADGGYIVSTQVDGLLLKLDSAGNIQWQKSYGGSLSSVFQTPDGGYVVGGDTTDTSASGDVLLMKVDATGAVQWRKTYGGTSDELLWSLRPTSDGGYILAGRTYSFGVAAGAEHSAFLLKVDAQGNLLWSRVYGGSWRGGGESIARLPDGGYIVVGEATLSKDEDVLVLRLDPDGNVLWWRVLRGLDYETARAVQPTSDGGFIMVVYVKATSAKYLVVKLGADGTVAWQKVYGKAQLWGYLRDNAIRVTPDGGYVVAGSFTIGGQEDVLLFKLDASGNVQWAKTYGGAGDERGRTVVATADGGYLIGADLGWGTGIWLIKVDSQGRVAPSCPPGFGASLSLKATSGRLSPTNADLASATVSPAVADAAVSPTDSSVTASTQCSA